MMNYLKDTFKNEINEILSSIKCKALAGMEPHIHGEKIFFIYGAGNVGTAKRT